MAPDRELPGARSAAPGRGCRERARVCHFLRVSLKATDSNSLINLNEVSRGAQEGVAGDFCLRVVQVEDVCGGDKTRLWTRSQVGRRVRLMSVVAECCSRNQVPGPSKTLRCCWNGCVGNRRSWRRKRTQDPAAGCAQPAKNCRNEGMKERRSHSADGGNRRRPGPGAGGPRRADRRCASEKEIGKGARGEESRAHQAGRNARASLPSMTRSRHRAAVVFRRIHVPQRTPGEAHPGRRARSMPAAGSTGMRVVCSVFFERHSGFVP